MNAVKYNLFHDEWGLRLWVVVTATIVGVLALLFGLGALAAVGNNHSVHVDCLRFHEQTGLPTKVGRSGPDAECYVLVSGVGWVPLENYRGVEVPV